MATDSFSGKFGIFATITLLFTGISDVEKSTETSPLAEILKSIGPPSLISNN